MDVPENIKAGLNWKSAVLDWIGQTSAYLKQQRIRGDNRIIFADHTPNGIILNGENTDKQTIMESSVRANLHIRYKQISGAYYVCVFNSNKYSTYPVETREDEDYEGNGYIAAVHGDVPFWMAPAKYQISPESLAAPLYIYAVMHSTSGSDPKPKIVFSRTNHYIHPYTYKPSPSIAFLSRVMLVNGQLEVYNFVDRHSPVIISQAQWPDNWMPSLYFTGSSLILEDLQEYLSVLGSCTLVSSDGSRYTINYLTPQRITGDTYLLLKFTKTGSPQLELSANGPSHSSDSFSWSICRFQFMSHPFVTTFTNYHLPSVLYNIIEWQNLIERVEALENE